MTKNGTQSLLAFFLEMVKHECFDKIMDKAYVIKNNLKVMGMSRYIIIENNVSQLDIFLAFSPIVRP